MVVNPGTLNKRIQICKDTRTQNNNGFYEENEAIIRECWAKISNSSGTESIKSGTDLSVVKSRFFIRYHRTISDIQTGWYIRYKDNIYDIEFINDYEEAHEYLEIWAVKRCQALN